MNKTVCNKISMIAPPVDLQNQFAAIAEKVEVLKSRNQQSLADLEYLHGTLSQKVLKCELDLSRVPLPIDATTEDSNHERHEKGSRI
jgi:type I restriction enzyme, S subunit